MLNRIIFGVFMFILGVVLGKPWIHMSGYTLTQSTKQLYLLYLAVGTVLLTYGLVKTLAGTIPEKRLGKFTIAGACGILASGILFYIANTGGN